MKTGTKYVKLTEKQWYNAVIGLATSFLTIRECKKCGYPIVDGYCCGHCGDANPYWTVEQEKEKGL